MTTYIIWILVSVSWSSHNWGTATVIERFATAADCHEVASRLPLQGAIKAGCIQARIVSVK